MSIYNTVHDIIVIITVYTYTMQLHVIDRGKESHFIYTKLHVNAQERKLNTTDCYSTVEV